MRIALNIGGHHHDLEAIRAEARRAAEDGLAGVWMSQIFGPDALTALALVGQEVADLELGVSIVPIYGRHPLALAMQARTVQAAVDGRLTLGIGPSHRIVVEALYGGSYAKPYTHTKEYLEALLPLLAGEAADVAGEEVTARGKLDIEAPGPPPVLVAGLGPKMLHLAGSRAAGTTLWMVGPKTIANQITPIITRAAAEAGRPAPRILAGVTACVTDDPDAARARSAVAQGMYGALPAYQRMMRAEGVAGPADLVVAGDEETVAQGLQRYRDVGVTDARVTVLAADEKELERTRRLLRSLA
ncbi:MAG TPA: TIGR03564 family F420-dependent LLM class oxidoreductase [Acidimicrobiales bacterium]|nr:TIGR03564 family F420-dependent LLM class oxidoreductase [Acidimicrobiales bacterium]